MAFLLDETLTREQYLGLSDAAHRDILLTEFEGCCERSGGEGGFEGDDVSDLEVA